MFKARIVAMRARGRVMADAVERVLLLAKYNAADTMGRTRAPGTVTPDDVINFVSKYFAEGHRGAADKARGYLAATFEWAIKSANDYTVANRQDWGVKTNPAAAVAKDHGASKPRDRNLTAAELRTFWLACQDGNAGFTEGTEVCLRVLMACGQRRTWKSRTHDAGIDRFTRDLIQQHAKGSDTGSKHYDRADYFKQMREAMDKWNAWLTAVVSDPPRVLALVA